MPLIDKKTIHLIFMNISRSFPCVQVSLMLMKLFTMISLFPARKFKAISSFVLFFTPTFAFVSSWIQWPYLILLIWTSLSLLHIDRYKYTITHPHPHKYTYTCTYTYKCVRMNTHEHITIKDNAPLPLRPSGFSISKEGNTKPNCCLPKVRFLVW